MSINFSLSNDAFTKPQPPNEGPDIIRNYQKFKQRIQSARKIQRVRRSQVNSEMRHYPLAYNVAEPDFRSAKKPPTAKTPTPSLPRVKKPVQLLLSQRDSFDEERQSQRLSILVQKVPSLPVSEQPSPSKPMSAEHSRRSRESSTLAVELDEVDAELHTTFIQTLGELKSLKFDLFLNHETLREKDREQKVDGFHTGSYFDLKNAFEKMIRKPLPDEIDLNSVILQYRQLNKILREILSSLIATDATDQAILLELLWKTNIKAFDNAIKVHRHHIDKLYDSEKTKVGKLKTKHDIEIQNLKEEMNMQNQEHQNEVQNLNEIIEKLKKKTENLDNAIADRETEIQQLTSIDGRNEDLKNMNHLMGQLNRFISETEHARNKQMLTLQEISTVMEMTEQLDVQPDISASVTQTDWQIKEEFLGIKLGSMDLKTTSDLHSFIYHQSSFNPSCLTGVHIQDRTLYTLWQWVFDEKWKNFPNLPITQLFLRFLTKRYRSPDRIAKKCAACLVRLVGLRNGGNHFASYFCKFLGLDNAHLQAEVFSMVQLATSQYQKLCATGNSLHNFTDFIQKTFYQPRETGERIISKIRGTKWEEEPLGQENNGENSFAAYVDDKVVAEFRPQRLLSAKDSLICKFCLTVEKVKGTLKNLVETEDRDKRMHFTHQQFVEICKYVLNMWVNPQEIDILIKEFDPEDEGVIYNRTLLGFNFKKWLDVANSIRVGLHEFIWACVQVWEEIYSERSESLGALYKSFTDLDQFQQVLQTLQHNISDELVTKMFSQYLSTPQKREDFVEILIRNLNPVLIAVPDARARRPPAKNPRGKRK